MTTFVSMFHPNLPGTIVDPVRVAEQAIDEHAARGWLLVDPDEVLPAPSTPYYTTAAADSRFLKTADTTNPASAFSVQQRAAFVAADPALSDFVYDGATGNLTSYKEDGVTITLTYNADGTVATSKRGANATKTFSYSGGNLAGVA